VTHATNSFLYLQDFRLSIKKRKNIAVKLMLYVSRFAQNLKTIMLFCTRRYDVYIICFLYSSILSNWAIIYTSKPVGWKPVDNILLIIVTTDNIMLKKITGVPDLPIWYAVRHSTKLNEKLSILIILWKKNKIFNNVWNLTNFANLFWHLQPSITISTK